MCQSKILVLVCQSRGENGSSVSKQGGEWFKCVKAGGEWFQCVKAGRRMVPVCQSRGRMVLVCQSSGENGSSVSK